MITPEQIDALRNRLKYALDFYKFRPKLISFECKIPPQRLKSFLANEVLPSEAEYVKLRTWYNVVCKGKGEWKPSDMGINESRTKEDTYLANNPGTEIVGNKR